MSDEKRFWGHAVAKPSMAELLESRERLNRVSVDFLKVDLETALTFVRIARQASDCIRKKRNCRAARKGFETVVSLCQKLHLNTTDQAVVKQGLARLKTELEEVEKTF